MPILSFVVTQYTRCLQKYSTPTAFHDYFHDNREFRGLNFYVSIQGDHAAGKVGEFDIGRGKVGKLVSNGNCGLPVVC